MNALGRHVAARESARHSKGGQLEGAGPVSDTLVETLAGAEGCISDTANTAEPPLQVSWHIQFSSAPAWLTNRPGYCLGVNSLFSGMCSSYKCIAHRSKL